MIRDMPWEESMLRYSIVSISKPKEASMGSNVASATLAMSIILFRSLGHSMNVIRRYLAATTVIGPVT